ncbi:MULTISPECIES: ABC transporter ATP-binding protein [Alphaproteobacteria]|uniref:ATP-binding protein n=2 Tax=Alphaproteobacteria TaxID=28211 RepID=A0A512HJR4_9HYPH|nr:MULTISPECIES: ABC transporter ATP-binding protein [Alphaproteobacteria]GEO85692.1 ATP-binding protein [Ciceribacter naphthalenivorans]GLR21949.1 ATP-binding protein [Ciceribacter naphthalenivorans]GLT04805.1 ATP-binding protein [Sphingomonas psychrolutea]
MIRLEQASKFVYARGTKKPILDGVSLVLKRGRSVGLLGRNGAGKSTLLRLFAGTIRLDGGRIVREGRISWPLGFQGSFQANLTGEQNVRFVARIYGVDSEKLIDYVANFAELGAFFRSPVGTYSSGMKARLAFGLSMGIKFDYYLVDEITAVGDANFKNKCHEVFRTRLADSDVIMVSHSTGTIRDYCDCGIVLEKGKLTYFDNVEDAIRVHDKNMKDS